MTPVEQQELGVPTWTNDQVSVCLIVGSFYWREEDISLPYSVYMPTHGSRSTNLGSEGVHLWILAHRSWFQGDEPQSAGPAQSCGPRP